MTVTSPRIEPCSTGNTQKKVIEKLIFTHWLLRKFDDRTKTKNRIAEA